MMHTPDWKKFVFGLALLGVIGVLDHLRFHHHYFAVPAALPLPADTTQHSLSGTNSPIPQPPEINYEP